MTQLRFNLPLGAAIHDIRMVAEPPPPDAAPALDLPVRMAVVGGPFTGKTTLAQALAEAQSATVIVPENLVQAALLAAAQYIEPQVRVLAPHTTSAPQLEIVRWKYSPFVGIDFFVVR